MANRIAVNFNQRIWNGEISQVAAMCTTMLPLVNVAGGYWSFTYEPVDTPYTPITDVFDFYSRDFAANSGHDLIIEETGRRLNHDRQGFLKAVIQTSDGEDRLRHTADAGNAVILDCNHAFTSVVGAFE